MFYFGVFRGVISKVHFYNPILELRSRLGYLRPIPFYRRASQLRRGKCESESRSAVVNNIYRLKSD